MSQQTRLVSRIPDGREIDFASSASDALACKLAALANLERMQPFIGQHGQIPWNNELDWREDIGMLAAAPVFFWGVAPARLVTAAAESYPITGDIFLPGTLRAFCVFEQPTLFVSIEGYRAALSAISWTAATSAREPHGPYLELRGYIWTGAYAGQVLTGMFPRRPASHGDYESIRSDMEGLTRWACTASMFIEQKLLAKSSDYATRQLRKAAERQRIQPEISVIALRQIVRASHSDSGVQAEYNVQWFVRGHWRNQWFPSANRHAPRWIAPYIKGPDDKPLKVPAPTVFAVTR